MPHLQNIFEEYADQGFEIVGISMDTGDAADDVSMFVDEYSVTYTILHDPEMRGMELYRVLGLPATFLIDLDPEVAFGRLHTQDRLESHGVEFQHRVRAGFLELVRAQPDQFTVIDGRGSPDEIHDRVLRRLEERGW